MGSLAPGLPLPPPVYRPGRKSLVLAWIPTFLWLGVLAFESTSVFTFDHTQTWVFRVLRVLFGLKFALSHALVVNEYGRKSGHFVGYGILSFFSFFGWTEFLAYHKQVYLDSIGKLKTVARRWHLRSAFLAVLVTFAAAGGDEFHQAFVPGRTATFRDVILDTLGGLFAQVLILLFWRAGRKEKPASVSTPTGAAVATRV